MKFVKFTTIQDKSEIYINPEYVMSLVQTTDPSGNSNLCTILIMNMEPEKGYLVYGSLQEIVEKITYASS